ncbi:MFS transporter [Cryobacterium arcticum]|uniref:Major facilitator transporter n=1 Tax=Cryobacterium arcticum TaxID=670052 RepID=A0A1B1BFP8_9MICO|nr:MFS transporter [Cryobacterium arcticum]ANP71399.1 major facilitator transporter [Cryobacterium arcticum]
MPHSTSPTQAQPRQPSIFAKEYVWVTVGILALIFLAAFEALAVTTVMPTISAALNGASLYALAFSGPLAVGVVGMVAAGNWADRSGPVPVVITAVALFVVGLVIAGTAASMPALIVGRLVHGLGGGALSVSLYVVVARVYPQRMHPAIFGAFAGAWVIPSLIGPFIAGVVVELTSWRWVFLGVVVLVLAALVMLRPGLVSVAKAERERPATVRAPWRLSRTLWSLGAAAAVLCASLAAQLPGALLWAGTGLAFVLAGVALRPLLPAGTLSGRRGLPVVMSIRGLVSGAFLSTEVYLPALLTGEYRLSPVLAGLALTCAGITWATASWLQGRYATVLSDQGSMRLGSALLLVAIVASALTAACGLPAALAIGGWAVAGAGMGTLVPRQSGRVLRLSAPDQQGFNSSALLIADSIGAALALAATAVVFVAVTPLGGTATYTASFTLSALLAIGGLLLAGRVGRDTPALDAPATEATPA